MDYSGLAASLWEGIKGLGSDALGLFYDDGKINLQNFQLFLKELSVKEKVKVNEITISVISIS